VHDHCYVECTQCKEALSARLDGEESWAEQLAVDTHVAGCAACQRFGDGAAHVTRLARTAVATQEPDIAEAVLAAVPRSRRPQLVTALRVLLGLVGLAQAEMAVVGILGAHSTALGAQGVVLQGASLTHFAHESAAWNLALGVGFLWVAWRSTRSAGMVPTLATFVAVLTVLVVMDAMAGGVDLARLLAHGLVVLGLILMIVLDRLPRPTDGTVPGVPTLRPRRLDRTRSAGPTIGTGVDDLPPDLRPSAQRDHAAVARRRSA
jgi:predicted anti-sigma-YlaC factor YlaD